MVPLKDNATLEHVLLVSKYIQSIKQQDSDVENLNKYLINAQ